MQNCIIPASAAAVSNNQARMVRSSPNQPEGTHPGASNNCADQQQDGNTKADDSQMRAFRGVLRVVLVVLESCLSLAGFPVPGFIPENGPGAESGPGDAQEETEAAVKPPSSSYYAAKLAAQHQQWCSCMALMWRNILDCLCSGMPFLFPNSAPCHVHRMH